MDGGLRSQSLHVENNLGKGLQSPLISPYSSYLREDSCIAEVLRKPVICSYLLVYPMLSHVSVRSCAHSVLPETPSAPHVFLETLDIIFSENSNLTFLGK